LTEERRKELVKLAKNQAEQSRVAIRNIRRDGNDDLKKLLKDSKITEDDEAKGTAELQKLTDAYVGHVNQVLEEKEKEIMEV
jgi:ribosome recycling factor